SMVMEPCRSGFYWQTSGELRSEVPKDELKKVLRLWKLLLVEFRQHSIRSIGFLPEKRFQSGSPKG
ncbi:hypothetical protein KEJ32_07480, partial [Candidatus Bathyarchaeota archaeon]|nr:hypothetical protein [Candidatus Bathyarchaeota archaeon]